MYTEDYDRQKNMIVEIILNGLEYCLKYVEIAFKIFEESGAIDKIKQLKNNCPIGIAQAADTLLKVYVLPGICECRVFTC